MMFLKNKSKRNIVLLRQGWTEKVYKCPWFYPFSLKGYYAACEGLRTLKKLFPDEVYELKVYEFNRGEEKEISLNVNELK